MSDEYDIDKKESKKDDYNVVDDAHNTLGDSSDKIYGMLKQWPIKIKSMIKI